MGGAIAIRGFELEHDLAGRGTAQPFVAQGWTGNVAAQTFEGVPLLGAAVRVGMQTEPLSTHTALAVRHLLTGQAQRGIFPRQHFLSCPGAKGNAVGAGGRLQRGQGRIGIVVGQIRDLGVFFRERTFAGQRLQQTGDDPRE